MFKGPTWLSASNPPLLLPLSALGPSLCCPLALGCGLVMQTTVSQGPHLEVGTNHTIYEAVIRNKKLSKEHSPRGEHRESSYLPSFPLYEWE